MIDLITGLAVGSLYALVALGFAVVYRTSNVFNFAQGSMVAVASLLSYSAIVHWKLPFVVVLLFAAVVIGAIAAVQEFFTVRPVVGGNDGGLWLVSTLGVSVVLEAVAGRIWGDTAETVPIHFLDKLVNVGDGRVQVADLVLIGLAVFLTIGLDYFYLRTRRGKAFTAAANDREAAEARGINTRRLASISFVVAGVIAAIAGVLAAPITLAQADLGDLLTIKAFVAMAIGGFGSTRGALIGGLAIGLVEEYSALQIGANYQDFSVFVLLLVVLLLMPRGLFGERAERLV